LSEIISQWNVTLKEEPLIVDGNTLWCIHAVYVPVNANDVRNGNYMDIYVNQNKGFLTQKISYYDKGIAKDDSGCVVPIKYVLEVKEFADCGNGVYFPKIVEFQNTHRADVPSNGDGIFVTVRATALSINTTIPDESFDFQFPENLLVRQVLPGGKTDAMILWGANNKPLKEFHSDQELQDYQKHICGPKANQPHAVRNNLLTWAIGFILIILVATLVWRKCRTCFA
jgi:hypothetical protein